MSNPAECDEETKALHVLTHPLRLRIAKVLQDSTKPLYIAQLSRKLGNEWDRKIISFHLMKMESFGLADSRVDLVTHETGNPVAVRYFTLTDKAKAMLKRCNL